VKIVELIEQLKLFDGESVVVCRGFDGEGFSDIKIEANIFIQKRPSASAQEIFGEYVKGTPGDQKAVLIDQF
jgi:hypothetical protein